MFYRYVEGAELFTCGNYVYNHYHDCKDANHFLSADSICDVICIPTNKVPDVTPVLACQDRVLRVLQVRHITHQYTFSGIVYGKLRRSCFEMLSKYYIFLFFKILQVYLKYCLQLPGISNNYLWIHFYESEV